MYKMRKSFLVKVIGLVCTLALVLGTVLVPLSLSAGALTIPVTPDETITFGFEPEEKPETSNNGAYESRGEDNIGLASWAFGVKDLDGYDSKVLGGKCTTTWATSGGYRLNNESGVYRLDTSSTYVVKFKITFRGVPTPEQITSSSNPPYIKLGYGFGGSLEGNNVTSMSNVISDVAVVADGAYLVTDISGTREIAPSSAWYNLTYVFNTPADFGSVNNSLGFFARQNEDFEIWIDDVQVTKLGENTGVVVAIDEYYGNADVLLGTKGEDVVLSEDIEGTDPSHEFLGWYSDVDRVTPVEALKFGDEAQIVYTKWKAPVKVTFIDELNGTSAEVSGLSGDPIEYPADPVDTKNDPVSNWFIDWYTTKQYSEVYSATTFGYSDIEVYAKWQGVSVGFTQDFENYDLSVKETDAPDDEGMVYYKNYTYFSTAMEKIEDPTNSGRGNVVKYEWDSTMTKVADDPATYDAADYGTYLMGSLSMDDYDLTVGGRYVMYFDYYVEEIADQTYTMSAKNVYYKNGWVRGDDLDTKVQTITSADKDGKWHTGGVVFTMTNTCGYENVFAILRSSKNADAKIYLDNFRFVPIQPYQVLMTVDANNGEPVQYVPVNKGEAFAAETPVNGDRVFDTWFADQGCSVKFTETVYPSEDFSIYARWKPVAETFQNYPFPTDQSYIFGKTMHIDKGEGVGIDDDAVLRFTLDGDEVHSIKDDGTTLYWAARRGSADSIAKLGTVADDAVYRISFWYKSIPNANVNTTIRMSTASQTNIWDGTVTYHDNVITVKPTDTEWQKAEFLLYTSLEKDTANALFLRFQTSGKDTDLEQYAGAFVDNVLIEPIDKPFVIFDALNSTVPVVSQGQAGEAVKLPATPVNPGYIFEGWYTDKEFTTEFDATVYEAGKGITVYAKYKIDPNFYTDFSDYPFSTTNDSIFGKTVHIDQGKGVGIDDDYVLRFTLDGDEVYSVADDGTVKYWAGRCGTSGHVAKLGTVLDDSVYKISFWYKSIPNANVNTTITMLTAQQTNVWGSSKRYTENTITVTPTSTEWQKAEFLLTTDLATATADALYIRFNTSGKTTDLEQYAGAYVDNLSFELIEKPFVIFDENIDKLPIITQGKVGEAIKFPATPQKVAHNFVGWYTDEELTVPFTETVYQEGQGIKVYAKYENATNFTIDFENMGKGPDSVGAHYLFFRGGIGGVKGVGYNKSTGIVFDRSQTTEWSTCNAFYEDGVAVTLATDRKYYVTFKYCVTQQLLSNGMLYFRSAQIGNAWGAKPSKVESEKDGYLSKDFAIPSTTEVGRWYTGALILDGLQIYTDPDDDNPEDRYAAVYLWLRGATNGTIVVDDVTFKAMPVGYQAYTVDNGGASSVPGYVTGPIGSSYRSKLPTNPVYENHYFKNYFRYDASHNKDIIEDSEMVFTEDDISIVANWVRLETVQDFEKYSNVLSAYGDYGAADFDYELYDATKEGNSADNVTSGRYSIHRKGNSAYFENIQILSEDHKICEDERFTITMKVKVGKHFHTDGAIKIAGCKSGVYAWTTSGSYHPIAAIADIADGEWHEVSYTFNSVERYLSIQTPGYVELFIDDVVITRVDPEMPVSSPVVFTEYVQALRDADGNLIGTSTDSIDVASIVDFSLYIEDFNILPILLIGGGVILIAAVVVVILLVLKKRKAKNA